MSELTSHFIYDVDAAIADHRPVLVEGAIDDNVLFDGCEVSVPEALALVGKEDAHGADAAEDEEHIEALAIIWTIHGGLTKLNADAQQDFEALISSVEGTLPMRDPLEIARLLGPIFAQSERNVLLVINHAELCCPAANDGHSRSVTGAMIAALEAYEANEVDHGLVLLSRDSAQIASNLVRRPGLARVRIGAHSHAERAHVAGIAFERDSSDPEIQSLATSTDGFALRDIPLLPNHSDVIDVGLDQSRELASSYRFGHKDDPWAMFTNERADDLKAALVSGLIGQDHVIEEVMAKLDVARSGLELDPPRTGARKSRLELFLVGPTGTGKNELVRILSESIFGDASAAKIFDMSTYVGEHAGERLFGAAPGFVGYSEGSPLVNWLLEKPFSVIVFDEIEKAHPNNWVRLMAAVDEGRVTDSHDRVASMENAIVVFTSNIGGKELLQLASSGNVSTGEVQDCTRELVEKHLTLCEYDTALGKRYDGLGMPEIWGRMKGSLVPFDILRAEAVTAIVDRFLTTLEQSNTAARETNIRVDRPSATNTITKLLGPPGTWNGRLIKAHIDDVVRKPLASMLVAGQFAGRNHLDLTITEGGGLEVEAR